MVHALVVFEVRRVLQVAGDDGGARGEATAPVAIVAVAVRRRYFLLTFVRWKGNVLRPQRGIYTVLEHQVRTYIYKQDNNTKLVTWVTTALRTVARTLL